MAETSGFDSKSDSDQVMEFIKTLDSIIINGQIVRMPLKALHVKLSHPAFTQQVFSGRL